MNNKSYHISGLDETEPVKVGRFRHSEKMAFLILRGFKDRYHNFWLNSKSADT